MGYALLKEKGLLRPKVGHPRLSARQRAASRWGIRGNPLISTMTASGPTLPGQYYDEETNLHYNYHRYYDPSIGRYITSDPIGIVRDYSNPLLQQILQYSSLEEAGFANQPLNHLYLYANANPIVFVDPLGLFGEEYCEMRCEGGFCRWVCQKLVDCVCGLGYGGPICCVIDESTCNADCVFDSNPSECVEKCTSDALKECQ